MEVTNEQLDAAIKTIWAFNNWLNDLESQPLPDCPSGVSKAFETLNQWHKEKEWTLEPSMMDIYNKAKEIVDSDISWELKYNLIFSDRISRLVNINWIDPDMGYKEDVLAFMSEFESQITKS